MLSVGFLLWASVELVGVSGFMNILRPGGGCGPGPCPMPPQAPFIPQRPVNCGQFPCPGVGPQGPFLHPPPINCGPGQLPCPQGPNRPPMVPATQHGSHYSGNNPGGGVNPPNRPPMVPATQQGSHYSGKKPGGGTPTVRKCTRDGRGICSLECDVGNYTLDATNQYTCGTIGDRCCVEP